MKYVKNTDFYKKPHVSLVGAGPGDPELISLKAYRLLQQADVVLYDALVAPALLEEVPSHVHKVSVGKRCGQGSWKQSDINSFIVDCAFRYGHVVRLKGGDPFVFGRGQEEVIFIRKFGISVDVIPGISSVMAAPGSAGIPLTHRGVSDSFWVVTATTRHHKLSNDLALAAQSSATLVILMGTRKLTEIVQLVSRHRKADTPVGLVQSATLAHQKVVLGQLDNIVQLGREAEFGAPGIIIIGDVVAQHPYFQGVKDTVEVASELRAKSV